MKRTFEVLNVKCGGCANTLKTKLEPVFGPLEVDLEAMPRKVTLEIGEERVDELRTALRKLGYPMADENLGFIDSGAAKAKSFVSCAVGKMGTE
jgi:copper chaperone CopZ